MDKRRTYTMIIFLTLLGGACAPSGYSTPTAQAPTALLPNEEIPAAERNPATSTPSMARPIPTEGADPTDEMVIHQTPSLEPATPALAKTTPAIPRYPPLSPDQRKAVDEARELLAGQLGIAVEQVELLYSEPVEWPDTSLGCPEAGRVYAPVLTPGYRVILRVRNQQYELHTSQSGKHAVLCPGPVPGERIPLRRARTQEEILSLAREHLAEKLGAPLEAVAVVSVEEALWDDDTLGCPRPPGKYPDRAYPGPIPGYRILLAVEGVQYEYHSDRLWLIFCDPPSLP